METPAAPPADLWARIRPQLSWHEIDHPSIARQRRYFLRQPRFLPTVEPRLQRYLHYLVSEVEARNLPIELALLPLVESLMDPFARSPQNAAGLWQIMPGTADDLGMRRDWWFDARLDIRDSTQHALDHLESLHAEFDGDWLITLAAYNAGKGRLQRTLKRQRGAGKDLDFWSLPLPRETQAYVPRVLALAALVAAEDVENFQLPEIPNSPGFVTVETGGQLEMLRAAQLSGLTLQTLRNYNPGHLQWATPPGRDTLLIPQGAEQSLRDGLSTLTQEQRVTWQRYRIRRGDSLIRIARQFDTRVELLREVNNIRGNMIRAGDALMIPDNDAWRASLAGAQQAGGSGSRQRSAYTVRRGDSLYRIAQRFRISIDELITWNHLDPARYLQPGQSLLLYLP